MSVWVCSDLHLGHRRVAELRGFDSVDEHDDAIATAWGDVVRDGDQVWVLGDLAGGCPTGALTMLEALPGEKHLVWGNHDQGHPMHRNAHRKAGQYLQIFASASAAARRRIGGREVLLSHFPYAAPASEADHTSDVRHTQWRLADEGRWLVHGHTHRHEQRVHGHQIHVGWDAWQRLVHLDEIAAMVHGGVEAPRTSWRTARSNRS